MWLLQVVIAVICINNIFLKYRVTPQFPFIIDFRKIRHNIISYNIYNITYNDLSFISNLTDPLRIDLIKDDVELLTPTITSIQ